MKKKKKHCSVSWGKTRAFIGRLLHIHIFVFCLTDFLSNHLFFRRNIQVKHEYTLHSTPPAPLFNYGSSFAHGWIWCSNEHSVFRKALNVKYTLSQRDWSSSCPPKSQNNNLTPETSTLPTEIRKNGFKFSFYCTDRGLTVHFSTNTYYSIQLYL